MGRAKMPCWSWMLSSARNSKPDLDASARVLTITSNESGMVSALIPEAAHPAIPHALSEVLQDGVSKIHESKNHCGEAGAACDGHREILPTVIPRSQCPGPRHPGPSVKGPLWDELRWLVGLEGLIRLFDGADPDIMLLPKPGKQRQKPSDDTFIRLALANEAETVHENAQRRQALPDRHPGDALDFRQRARLDVQDAT